MRRGKSSKKNVLSTAGYLLSCILVSGSIEVPRWNPCREPRTTAERTVIYFTEECRCSCPSFIFLPSQQPLYINWKASQSRLNLKRLKYIITRGKMSSTSMAVSLRSLPIAQSYLKTPWAHWNLLDYYTRAPFLIAPAPFLIADFPTKQETWNGSRVEFFWN